jgi:hypothetical protein
MERELLGKKLFHNPLLLRSAARAGSCVLGAKTSSTALPGSLRAFLLSILAGGPFARSRDETGYEKASSQSAFNVTLTRLSYQDR